MATFTVPDQYAGKSLKDIQSSTGLPFRSDILAGQLGVSETAPLTKGQTFSFDVSDPGSGEAQAVQKLFTPGGVSGGSDLASSLNASEQALMDKYAAQVLGQEPLTSAYTRLSTEAGIPGLQSDINKYKQNIYNVQSLLDNLESDITGRTKGTLTSEPQRRRQIAAESSPLVANLGRLTTGLQPLTDLLTTGTGNVATQISLEQAQQNKELLPIQARISAFSDQAAREISLYTTQKQNDLTLLTQKLKQQGDLSMAEYQRASDLLKSEKDYLNQKNLIAAQMNANITYYNATTGKTATDANKYKTPAYSPVGGTGTTAVSGGVTWKWTGSSWVPAF